MLFVLAIIETCGKQYKVSEGDIVYLELLGAQPGENVTFDRVLAVSGTDSGITIGTPYVSGASVSASVIANGKSKKITVFRYKPKKNQKRKLGHRQPYTKVKIEKITV